jgi:sulfur transfer complex TusBCD TusB component (DsrH family)
MKFYKKILFTFFINFIIQYFIFSAMLLNSLSDFTHNVSKFYIATIVGLVMVMLDIVIHKIDYDTIDIPLFITILSLLVLFLYLYRIQYAVSDNEYLKQLKENDSAALLISKAMEARTNTYEIAKITKNIIQNDSRDFIDYTREKLKV